MGDTEETTPTTRTTRSSSIRTALECQPPKVIQTDTSLPSLFDDLLFTEQSISLQYLISSFPGRKLQILHILRLIGQPNSPVIPLFVYGSPSSGKTSVILGIFRYLNRPFVYTSCRSCYSPRILFESLLNQLLPHRRNADNGYSSARRCEKVSDFVNFLRGALVQVIDTVKSSHRDRDCGSDRIPSKKSGSKAQNRAENERQSEKGNQRNGGMIYLIFDNVELIRDWDKNSSIIPVLFKINEILKLPEVVLIFISNASLDTFYSNTGFVEPIPVFFPDYTEDDIYRIFMKSQANPKLYSAFLDVVLKPFCRITRRIDELAIALPLLFHKYCEPLSDLGVVPDEAMKRRLFSHLQPHITPGLNQVFKVQSQPLDKTDKEKVGRKGGKGADELDFQMSVSAKYLLISAFLASRNPATLDAALFDSTGGSDNRKRRRKEGNNAADTLANLGVNLEKDFFTGLECPTRTILEDCHRNVMVIHEYRSSETSMERKDNAAQELLMKGPGTFPLERLLAIYQCIISVSDSSFDEEQHEHALEREGGNIGLMSDVLLQLSTLCSANFICKGGSCPLEGSTRYRSTVGEEMALKVARSINFPLSKYLYRR